MAVDMANSVSMIDLVLDLDNCFHRCGFEHVIVTIIGTMLVVIISNIVMIIIIAVTCAEAH